MKTIKQVTLYSILFVFAATFFSSCTTSNDVVNNSLIQKRKYRSGFYVSKKADKTVSEFNLEKTELALEKEMPASEISTVPQSKTKLKVIQKVAERVAEKKTAKAVENTRIHTTRTDQDVRRTSADFSTSVATASLLQRRAMDPELKMAIIFAVVAAASSLIASILYLVTGSLILYYLILAVAIVATVFSVIHLVKFFQSL